jgi:multiple sugar transport system substrate-binding protein
LLHNTKLNNNGGRKMRKMKKVKVFFGVCLLLMTTILGACGQSEVNKPADSSIQSQSTGISDSVPAQTGAESAEPTVIKMTSWESVKKSGMEAAVAEYEKLNPNIKVDIEFLSENDAPAYLKKVDLMLMAGEDIDVIAQNTVAAHVQKANQGVLAPVDEYFEKDGIKYDDIYQFSTPVNGKNYAFPSNMKTYCVLINQKHLDEAGLAKPANDWTWDDFRKYAIALTKGEGANKRYGSYMHLWETLGSAGLISTKMDTPYFKEDGSLNFDDPMFKEWMQFRNQLENVDKCQTPYYEIKSLNLAYRDMFFNEKASMVVAGTWLLTDIKDTSKYPHDFVTTFAPLPRWKDAPAGRTLVENDYLCIPASSKRKEETYRFLKFFTTDGMTLRGTDLSAQKNVDINAILGIVLGNNPEKLFDVESLKGIFSNSEFTPNVRKIMPEYGQQIMDIYSEEFEKYLVGGIDVDTAISNMAERGSAVAKK